MRITSVEIEWLTWHHQMESIHRWLKENIGPGVAEHTDAWSQEHISWSTWHRTSIGAMKQVFEFRDENHATMFKMVWG